MPYPETINLPFNAHALGEDFVPARQGDEDPGGPGIWLVFRGDALALESGENASLAGGEQPAWAGECRRRLLIGTWQGKPVRVLELDTDAEIPPGHLVEPLLALFFHQRLSDGFLSLAGRAQQILAWERRSAVCSRCGCGNGAIPGTWGKRCTGCGAEHFPHIHPCTLVLVTRGDEVLLIRKPEWPPGYYSIPSGFCDFGESLEECAAREVEEETGVRIRNLRYVGSQSWPFPAQLMTGFTADYGGGDIVVDRGELEDAAWFRRDRLPPTFSSASIAGWMLETFGRVR
ncbi:MAG: NAD(+) diphosphatase [Geobacteraceae bacterium]|nr:NAD(+) diphosphatase [Geobacteraceae bacterium]